jgi:hypothetical protein
MGLILAIVVALTACHLAAGFEDEDAKLGKMIIWVNLIETESLYFVSVTWNIICYVEKAKYADAKIRTYNNYFRVIK